MKEKKIDCFTGYEKMGLFYNVYITSIPIEMLGHLFADTFYIPSNTVYIINLYNTAFQFHKRNFLCTYRLNLGRYINVEYSVTELFLGLMKKLSYTALKNDFIQFI